MNASRANDTGLVTQICRKKERDVESRFHVQLVDDGDGSSRQSCMESIGLWPHPLAATGHIKSSKFNMLATRNRNVKHRAASVFNKSKPIP